jgi:lactate dehydrogenase-like 2-hydroxyacid dehydrogenase
MANKVAGDRPRKTKPVILQMAELARFPHRSIDDQFEIIRYWQAEDPDSLLERKDLRVRGMIAAGPHRIDDRILEKVPHLEIIASIGVGYDRLDIDAVARRGIIATNTPDVLTEEVADLTVGLLIATVRRMPQGERHIREGHWAKRPFPNSPSLRGRSIGIVGLGRIGKAVARRLQGFEIAEICYCGRRRQPEMPYRYFGNVADLAAHVSVLILALPGGPDTNGLVDADVLRKLGSDGILINVARAAVVDKDALVAALRDGIILAAGLDVFWMEPHVPQELLALDNVVLLPHVGSASQKTRAEMVELLQDNLIAWFDERRPLTPVAETPWPPKSAGGS